MPKFKRGFILEKIQIGSSCEKFQFSVSMLNNPRSDYLFRKLTNAFLETMGLSYERSKRIFRTRYACPASIRKKLGCWTGAVASKRKNNCKFYGSRKSCYRRIQDNITAFYSKRLGAMLQTFN